MTEKRFRVAEVAFVRGVFEVDASDINEAMARYGTDGRPVNNELEDNPEGNYPVLAAWEVTP